MFQGTSHDVEADWSVVMTLDAKKLGAFGDFSASGEVPQEETENMEAVARYLKNGELPQYKQWGSRQNVFSRLKEALPAGGDLKAWAPVVSLIADDAVVWTPTKEAPPDAFQRSLVRAQVFHKAIFWAWEQLGSWGDSSILEDKPHFIVTWDEQSGEPRVEENHEMKRMDKAVVEYLKANLTAALGD